MEKTFQLEQRESQQLQQMDQERTQALAVIGALSLDMEQAKKNLEAAAERQRAFIRQALMNRSVERYDNARVQSGAIIVTLPDQQVETSPRLPVERINGSVIDIPKE